MANHARYPLHDLNDWNGEHSTGNTGSDQTVHHTSREKTRRRDLLLAFTLLFVPLLAIPLIFLAFVFYTTRHVTFPDKSTPRLPLNSHPLSKSYYTTVSAGSFTLVGSWASTLAQFVLAPFMALFSFYVAREIALKRGDGSEPLEMRNVMHEILRANPASIWQWLTYTVNPIQARKGERQYSLRPVHIAALGLTLAGLCSFLIVVGDTWLHLTVQTTPQTVYKDSTRPSRNSSIDSDDYTYAASFTTVPGCDVTLSTPISSNLSTGPFPCSLNTTGIFNLADASNVYITLATGINTYDTTSGIFSIGPPSNGSSGIQRRRLKTQVLTIPDARPDSSHSFLFYPDASSQYDNSFVTNYGADYAVSTTSMVTQCVSATQACHLVPQSSPTNGTISIPFNCSADFNGDLGQPPLNGLERVQGWDSGFYANVNGSPNTSVQAQSNPFYFYAAAAVNSLSFADLKASGDPQANDFSVIDAGNQRLAFALSCQATIYDVTYSVINGQIIDFTNTTSSPQKASIVKAPLQVGFGRYDLYQSALLSVLVDDTVANYMSTAFSQIGIALASGAFTYELNSEQRIRYDLQVTQVPKAPLWFLVSVCLIYILMSLGALVAALALQRKTTIAETHANLLPTARFRIRKSLRNAWEVAKDQVGYSGREAQT